MINARQLDVLQGKIRVLSSVNSVIHIIFGMFSFRVDMETIGSIYSQEYQVKLGHNYLDVHFYLHTI